MATLTEKEALERGYTFSMPLGSFAVAKNNSVLLGLTTLLAPVEIISAFLASDISAVEVRLYEGLTYTGGTSANPVPNNRYKSEPLCVFASFDVAATLNPAAVISDRTYYSKSEGFNIPMNGISAAILAPTTSYIIELYNASNMNSDISFEPTFACRNDLLGPFYQ